MTYYDIACKMLGHEPCDALTRMLNKASERVRLANDEHADLRSSQVVAAIIAIWETTA